MLIKPNMKFGGQNCMRISKTVSPFCGNPSTQPRIASLYHKRLAKMTNSFIVAKKDVKSFIDTKQI
jgi:hypothetical protein